MKRLICALIMCVLTASPNDCKRQNTEQETGLLASIPSGNSPLCLCLGVSIKKTQATETQATVHWLQSKPIEFEIDGQKVLWYPVTQEIPENLRKKSIKIDGTVPEIKTGPNRLPVPIATDDPIYHQLIQQCQNLLCPVCNQSNVSFRQAKESPDAFWLNNNNCERMQCTVNLTPQGCEITLTGVMQTLLSRGTLKIEIDSESVKSYFKDTFAIIDTEGRGVYESCLYHLRTVLGEKPVRFHKDALGRFYRYVLGLRQDLFTLNDLISSLEAPGLRFKIDQFMRVVQSTIQRERRILDNKYQLQQIITSQHKDKPKAISSNSKSSYNNSSSSSSYGHHGPIDNVSHTLSQAIFYVGQNAIQVPMINNLSIEIETLSEVSHLIEPNLVRHLSVDRLIIIPAINIKISFNTIDQKVVEFTVDQDRFTNSTINLNALIMAASKWVMAWHGTSYNKILYNDTLMEQLNKSMEYLVQSLMSRYTQYVKSWPNIDIFE